MVLELVELLEGTDVRLISRMIRRLTLDEVSREGAEMGAEFQVFLRALPALFSFLDVVEDELLVIRGKSVERDTGLLPTSFGI
ncbi:MAG: hypothetical protein R8G66_30595 [Cytophagales bacterium]|nr:hypothetical protein [Cytophagales bacterium]